MNGLSVLSQAGGQFWRVSAGKSTAERLVHAPGGLACGHNQGDGKTLSSMDGQYQAFHDSLTGLPNRFFFLDHLRRTIAESGKNGLKRAVIFIDLDRFKNTNDLSAVKRLIRFC